MKEEFFSKFIDYNNRLEKLLETKDFSTDTKNLLLSMLYKIDSSYSDYQTVKRNVKSKQTFLEEVLRMVENCESIEIVKPNSEEGLNYEKEGVQYKVNPLTYEIRTFENERVVLEALLELDNARIYLPEKYNLIRVAFPDLLNEGKLISNVEIIRDFNAWSWNILTDEISNFYANLIYQNLECLIGQEELEEWMMTEEVEDKIEWLKNKLEEENDKEKVTQFLDLIYQISIDCCANKNKIEKVRLLDEKTSIQEEYEKRIHMEEYLEEITQNKKNRHKEIERIDKILNDKQLLKEEYRSRNKALKEYNKILNEDHLVEILTRQRKKILREVEQYNQLLQPNQYLETLDHMEKELALLEDLEKGKVSKRTMEEKLIKIETWFLTFLKEKIKQSSTKKERMDLVYILRYYEKMPFNQNKSLGQVKELQSLFQEIEESILQKMQEEKQINKLSEDKNFNIKIMRNLFQTKMIDLENMYIQFKQKEDDCLFQLYDKEILEQEIQLQDLPKEIKEFKIKKNKMIKVFI